MKNLKKQAMDGDYGFSKMLAKKYKYERVLVGSDVMEQRYKEALSQVDAFSSAQEIIDDCNENLSFLFSAQKHIPDITKWDTSRVSNMREMFSNTRDFNQDISNWDTSSITDMSHMFDGAAAFEYEQKFNATRRSAA